MFGKNIKTRIDEIKNRLGSTNTVVVKNFLIGKGKPIDACLIYIAPLVDNKIIENSILSPLMLYSNESQFPTSKLPEYICKKYLTLGETTIEDDLNIIIDSINHGKSALLLEGFHEIIILNTTGGEFRSITDPQIESSVRGTREGFVENLETNLSILKRRLTDKNLVIEIFELGRRSKTKLAYIYIKDIICPERVNEIRSRIKAIDVDYVPATSYIEQFIENNSYSIFPQFISTERPDIIISGLMEGQAAVLLAGTPFALLCPAILPQFFQAVEDYYHRTIVASFTRIVRAAAIVVVILLPSIYLTLINYNVELIPVKLLNPIYQSRQGIALSPLLEILSMEIIIEFLREGGLRLPPKIAATLSIVGGIIIGNAAVESKLSSPSTLLIVGVSTVASFIIPNYEMAVSLRLIRFPMLLLADALGFLGIAAGTLFIFAHIFSLENFGVDYFTITKKDLTDLITRSPLWKMNKRPDSIPSVDKNRQSDFRQFFRRGKNDQ